MNIKEQLQPCNENYERRFDTRRVYAINTWETNPNALRINKCHYEKFVEIAGKTPGFRSAVDSLDLPAYCSFNTRFCFKTASQAKEAMQTLAELAISKNIGCWFERSRNRFWVTEAGIDAYTRSNFVRVKE